MNVLQGLHHRQGYRQEQLLDDTWGFSVDVAIVGGLLTFGWFLLAL